MAVVGGGSGIGLAVALAAARAGARVVIAGRTQSKLDAVVLETPGALDTQRIDVTDELSVASAFEAIGPVDHLVVSAGEARMGPLASLPLDEAYRVMRSKFWGAYLCARSAELRPGGSLTLFSGVVGRRPSAGGAALAGANAAVEAMGRALALELAPVRVNTVSPGLVDSGAYDGMGEDERDAMFAETAARLPVGRVGRPGDVASAVLMLMSNPFITGTTLDVDGGGLVATGRGRS